VAGLGAKSLQDEHFMNKRRSKSFNRSNAFLGHPFATLPSTNMFRINQHTTTLPKTLFTASLLGGAALSTLGAGSAQAVDRFDCSFGASIAHPLCSSIDWETGWELEDKKLTKLTYFSTIGPAEAPPSGDFSFIYDDFGPTGLSPEDMWQVLTTFDPDIPGPLTGSYSYDLAITDPGKSFLNVKLEDVQAGSTKVKKVVKDSSGAIILASLESIDGGDMGPVPISGTSIKVTDSWEITPSMGVIDSINNTYMQVPAPLPILGAGAAFGSIRKLRKFSSRLKTFSMR
jgi:hypothetical protein